MKLKLSKQNRVISGIALITLAILVGLSICYYNTTDYDTSSGSAEQTENLMGSGGAFVSHYLINYTFGYATFLICVIMTIWGWQIIRQKTNGWIKRLSLYIFLTMVMISYGLAIIGEFSIGGAEVRIELSGMIGGFFASYSAIFLGKPGTIIVYFALVIILLVLWSKFKIWVAVEKSEKIALKIWNLRKKLFKSVSVYIDKQKRRKKIKDKVKSTKISSRIKDRPEKTAVKSEREPVINREEIKEEIEEDVSSANPLDKYYKEDKPESETRININRPSPPPEQDSIQTEPEPQGDEPGVYNFPPLDFLIDPPFKELTDTEEEMSRNAEILETTLLDFGVKAKVVEVHPGPVLTLYEVRPNTGVKISRILSLQDDIAMTMKAKGIRLIAPIPGKDTVGVEIPNLRPQTIYLKSLLVDPKFSKHDSKVTLALGRTISGDVFYADLAKLPHLLIAGQTGSGKSIGVNTIIASILYQATPKEVQFILIDPKMVELSMYKKLDMHHLLTADFIDEKVITKPQNAVLVLKALVNEMEKRYTILAKFGVRNIVDYNTKPGPKVDPETEEEFPEKMEYIVLIVDELADLMMVAQKDIEEPIARIAQMARAVGIHLILATQRPSVDVLTGYIKSNFPARIAYRVFSKTDSRTILDMNGADTLLGKGDMLYLPPGTPKPVRIQNPMISTEEIEQIVDHISKQPKFVKSTKLELNPQKGKNSNGSSFDVGDRDTLFEEAAKIVVTHQQGSISLLQRRLKIGYSRAARLIDEMEEVGIVGPYDGSKARQVMIDEDELGDYL
ncbi:MAG: DNA translocase FtsK [bacterium]|nr:DNA translocase FtsK [bacterium]